MIDLAIEKMEVKKHESGAKAMANMGEDAPEDVSNSSQVDMDGQSLKIALHKLEQAEAVAEAAENLRNLELAAVPINKVDVGVIASEFDITDAEAEKTLRENKGKIHEALMSLVLK